MTAGFQNTLKIFPTGCSRLGQKRGWICIKRYSYLCQNQVWWTTVETNGRGGETSDCAFIGSHIWGIRKKKEYIICQKDSTCAGFYDPKVLLPPLLQAVCFCQLWILPSASPPPFFLPLPYEASEAAAIPHCGFLALPCRLAHSQGSTNICWIS